MQASARKVALKHFATVILWENHRIEDVATFDAWKKNKELVLDFYNQRRRQLFECEPNEAHKLLVKLEEKYNVQIITQNVDDLHERAVLLIFCTCMANYSKCAAHLMNT